MPEILQYTKEEGGEWITPTGKFTEEDVRSMPLHTTYKGCLWGFVHSYIREDGKYFHAGGV